jgi:hypothetical protein
MICVRLLCVALAAGCAAEALAQARRLNDRELVDRVRARYEPAFSLNGLPWLVDPELREQGEAIRAEHLERARALLTGWVEQEQSLGRSEGELVLRGTARALNEIAAWRADSLGPEDDAMQRRLRTAPGVCRHAASLSPFGLFLVQVQALPAADRQRALDLERERLARWGKARPSLPNWPVPAPEVQLEQALAEARKAEGRVDPPMVPALADGLFREPTRSPLSNPPLRCEAVRWWLQRAGDAPGAVDVARLATMPRPPSLPPSKSGPDGYPFTAVRYGVEGQTRVRLTVDAQGRVVEAHVVERQLAVPGLEGLRPIAFETEFDATSLARARATRWDGPVVPGTRSVEFSWKLE